MRATRLPRRTIYARGSWPISGGTGRYYRAPRAAFPGTLADARCAAVSGHRATRGPSSPRLLNFRLIPRNISTRDLICGSRLEVSSREPTRSFAATVRPLAGYRTLAWPFAPMPLIADGGEARGCAFEQCCSMLFEAAGARHSLTARPSAVSLPAALEHRRWAERGPTPRADRPRERHYARRPFSLVRKEPNLVWLQASGERFETLTAVESLLA